MSGLPRGEPDFPIGKREKKAEALDVSPVFAIEVQVSTNKTQRGVPELDSNPLLKTKKEPPANEHLSAVFGHQARQIPHPIETVHWLPTP